MVPLILPGGRIPPPIIISERLQCREKILEQTINFAGM